MKFKRILIIILSCLLGFTFIGCGEGVSDEPNTINIRVYKAGYGDTHIRMLIAKFEELYSEENYKVNIVQSDPSVIGSTVTNELALGSKNGIDMYFPGNLSPTAIVYTSLAEGRAIAEPLNDLFDEYPIRADGTVETMTIREKMRPGMEGHATFHDYRGKSVYDNVSFSFPTYTAAMSLIVNENLLKTYNLDIPVTSKELINAFNVIKAKTNQTGVYATSWGGNNAAPYWRGLSDVWAAQYDGADYYRDWVSLNVDNLDDAWRLYEDYQGWAYSLTAMETMVNLDYAPLGTTTKTHTDAQHTFLTGKSVFYVCGAWLQTEMEKNYSEQAKQMKMVNAPVISELGVKIGLGATVAESDPYLAEIVRLIDEGADNETIKESVDGITLTDEQIDAVRTARSIVYNRIIFDGAVISASSTKKDICKLFLKLLASDDGIKIFYDYANCISAFLPQDSVEYADKGLFVRSVKEIMDNPNKILIHRLPNGTSLRSDLGLGWFYNAAGVNYSDYTEVPMALDRNLKGADIWRNSQKYVRDNWNRLMQNYSR